VMNKQKTKLIGIGLLSVPLPTLLLFLSIEERLRKSGFLNTLDLYFIGNDTGTLRDYLTNVWYWDAFGAMLLLMLPVGLITGAWLLLRNSNKP